MVPAPPRSSRTDTTFLVVLTVKNEGAFLLDWLAHHVAAGANRFLVLSNDCDDGTDAMLDRLEEMEWLVHLRNPGPYHKRGVHFTALKTAHKHDLVREADWILPIDIDEYVNVKTGDHSLQALVRALPQATAITLTWRLFGNAGIARDPGAPVTETFTRCAPEVMSWPWRAFMFKTLYRNDGTYRAMGVHRPRQPRTDKLYSAHWYDGSGRLLPDAYKTGRLFSNFRQSPYGLVQLNHYPLGACDSFVLKADRGRANTTRAPLGLDYWVERNFNQIEDCSIQALRSATRTVRKDFDRDATLATLHASAMEWRRARFAELMQEEPYRALYGRLRMAPASQLVGVEDASFLHAHAQAALDPDSRRR